MKASKPVRILELRGTYKGGGGPDKTILLSAARHNPGRVQIVVAYLRDPADHEFQITARAKRMGLEFHELKDRRVVDFKCIAHLRRLIKAYAIDELHAHDDKSLLYGWLLKLITPGLRIVYTCHLLLDFHPADFDSSLQYQNYLLRKRIGLFLTKRFMRPIMAVSGFCKKQLVREGLNDEDILVLHNGIDVDHWRPSNGNGTLRRELNLGENQRLIGTVARIDKQKDFPTFLDVVERVLKELPDVRFVIVGDGKGDEIDLLKQRIEEKQLNRYVYLTGHRNDLTDVYSSFDLFLMTSDNEGLPNTVLEAMAMGVPVVSTAVAGVPELVDDGSTGFLCDIGDGKRLAEKVVALIRNDSLRKDFGEKGRHHVVDNFSFNDRVRKLEDLYEFYVRD